MYNCDDQSCLHTVHLSTRLWGINPTNSVVIPQILVLRSIVLGGILIYRNSLIINHDVAFNKYSSQSSRLESGWECDIVSVVLIYYCLIVKIKTDCNHDAFIQVKFPNIHCA